MRKISFRFVSLTLVGLLCFSQFACQRAAGEEVSVASKLFFPNASNVSCVIESGSYFTTIEGVLMFYDFAAAKSVPVCSKTNCEHTLGGQDEKLCDAELHEPCALFVLGSKLYVVEQLFDSAQREQVLRVTQSELDRSSRRVMGQIGAELCSSLVLFENKLYGAVCKPTRETDQLGFGALTGSAKNWIFSLSLDDGRYIEERVFDETYAALLRLGGIKDGQLFYCFSYSKENMWKDGSFGFSPEVAQFFKAEWGYLELGAKSSAPVKWTRLDYDEYLEFDFFLLQDKLYFLRLMTRESMPHESSYEFVSLSLQSLETERLFVSRGAPARWGSLLFYRSAEDGQGYRYDLLKERAASFPEAFVADYLFFETSDAARIVALKYEPDRRTWLRFLLERNAYVSAQTTGEINLE